jgi:hypothetical protein
MKATEPWGQVHDMIELYQDLVHVKHGYNSYDSELTECMQHLLDDPIINGSNIPLFFGPFGLDPMIVFLRELYLALIKWQDNDSFTFSLSTQRSALRHVRRWVDELTARIMEFRRVHDRDEFDPVNLVTLRSIIRALEGVIPVSGLPIQECLVTN